MIIIYDKSNSTRLLFVNQEGVIKSLYTPFQVLCIHATGHIKANTLVYVDAIACTPQDELLYIIQRTAHYYFNFYLIAKF